MYSSLDRRFVLLPQLTASSVTARSGATRRTQTLLVVQLRDDLVQIGKPPLLLLREQQPPVRPDGELRLGALLDAGIESERRLECGRETRGPTVVAASDRAVADEHAHAAKLSRTTCCYGGGGEKGGGGPGDAEG